MGILGFSQCSVCHGDLIRKLTLSVNQLKSVCATAKHTSHICGGFIQAARNCQFQKIFLEKFQPIFKPEQFEYGVGSP